MPATTARNLEAAEVKKTFGWLVRQYREARGWTPAELEFESGVYASAIRRYENEPGAGCTLATAYALACAFGTTIDKMLEDGGITYG